MSYYVIRVTTGIKTECITSKPLEKKNWKKKLYQTKDRKEKTTTGSMIHRKNKLELNPNPNLNINKNE